MWRRCGGGGGGRGHVMGRRGSFPSRLGPSHLPFPPVTARSGAPRGRGGTPPIREATPPPRGAPAPPGAAPLRPGHAPHPPVSQWGGRGDPTGGPRQACGTHLWVVPPPPRDVRFEPRFGSWGPPPFRVMVPLWVVSPPPGVRCRPTFGWWHSLHMVCVLPPLGQHPTWNADVLAWHSPLRPSICCMCSVFCFSPQHSEGGSSTPPCNGLKNALGCNSPMEAFSWVWRQHVCCPR